MENKYGPSTTEPIVKETEDNSILFAKMLAAQFFGRGNQNRLVGLPKDDGYDQERIDRAKAKRERRAQRNLRTGRTF